MAESDAAPPMPPDSFPLTSRAAHGREARRRHRLDPRHCPSFRATKSRHSERERVGDAGKGSERGRDRDRDRDKDRDRDRDKKRDRRGREGEGEGEGGRDPESVVTHSVMAEAICACCAWPESVMAEPATAEADANAVGETQCGRHVGVSRRGARTPRLPSSGVP